MPMEIERSSVISMKLNGGMRPGSSGSIITYNVSLGRMMFGADAEKILAVVDALLPCLKFSLLRLDRIETTTIEG